MGKKGDLLRQQKADKVIYHWSSRQMELHDEAVRQAFRDRVVSEANAKLKKELEAKENEIGAMILRYMFPTVMNVMVSKFGWKPASKIQYDKRNRLTQLAEAIVDEYSRIFDGEINDIERYEKESYELTGCKLTLVE